MIVYLLCGAALLSGSAAFVRLKRLGAEEWQRELERRQFAQFVATIRRFEQAIRGMGEAMSAMIPAFEKVGREIARISQRVGHDVG